MLTGKRRSDSGLMRTAIIAVIGVTFLTLAAAGTRAAGTSFIDAVKGFFGLQSQAVAVEQSETAASVIDRDRTAGRATASTTFVISQAYGGGGGTTGTYLKDYVELKNISSSPQSLAGLSLMYGSATGQFASLATNAYALTGGTVQPGQYYLVELSPAGTGGVALPVTADESTTNLNMSGTNGKVALVTSAFVANTCGGAATPCTLPNPDIIDLVAWGTANNAEGGAATNGGASITSVQGNVRKQNGCQDTDNNNSDFDIVTAPVPRNSTTTIACGGPTPTSTNTATASPTPTHTATPTSTATLAATPTASPSPVAGSTFVISHAYGGGGGTTGTYLNDYVELKNISSSPQSLAGLSLMYGSATGNFASTAANAYALTGGTVQPGQYYLIQLGPAGTAGAPLPVTPDETTGNLTMSGTNGKVALVTAALAPNTCGATATPCTLPNAAIVDLVAWGTANNAEGGASTNGGASLTSVQGNVRKQNGCQDTDNNNSDFDIVTAPVPRNSTTTIACGGPTPTSTNTATASPTPTHTATPTSTATLAATPTASPSPVAGSTFVISHAYGGGGGTTGTYLNDYVELKNISSSPQSLAGLSLMYGSATGNFASTAANAYALTGGTVQPGQYYLIQLGPAGTAGAPLPVTPDETTGNLTMSGTNGKVALVTAALAPNTCGATATPCTLPNAAIVDLVAWGTANNAEGGASTNGGASLTSVQGNVRKQNGCQDTDNNNSDFDIVTAPVPRNSATAAAPCAGGPSPTATNTFTPTNTPTSTPTAPPSGRTAFDYDGDHKTDISVFRPSDGAWYLQQSQAGLFGMLFGFGSDKIAPADYDGDGKTDIAVYRPSTGIWYVLKSTDGTVEYYVFGLAEDLPTPADYDGDGKADVSVYRPSTGTWYRQDSSDGSFHGIQFGATEDKPTIGDWDGDGKSDIAVFRPSTGAWYRINSGNGSIYGELFGFGTDVITPADFDGDHKMDLAAYRPSTGIWYVKFSSNSTYDYKVFGLANDIPAVGDFDGDGKADVSVFRPSDGTWYRQNSSNDAYVAFQFGANGDKPTMTAFRY